MDSKLLEIYANDSHVYDFHEEPDGLYLSQTSTNTELFWNNLSETEITVLTIDENPEILKSPAYTDIFCLVLPGVRDRSIKGKKTKTIRAVNFMESSQYDAIWKFIEIIGGILINDPAEYQEQIKALSKEEETFEKIKSGKDITMLHICFEVQCSMISKVKFLDGYCANQNSDDEEQPMY